MSNKQSYEPKYRRYSIDPNKTGWVDTGTVVHLVTGTDKVGIGTSTPTEKLTVVGNISALGTIYDSTRSSVDWSSVYNTVYNLSARWSSLLADLKICPPVECIVVPAKQFSWVNTANLSLGWIATLDWAAGGMQTLSITADLTPTNINDDSTKRTTFRLQNTAVGMTVSCRISAGGAYGAGNVDRYAWLKFPDAWRWVTQDFTIIARGNIAVLTLAMYDENEVIAGISVEEE